MAMFNFLYKCTGGNPGLVYAIIKETELGKREKMKRPDYAARSIQAAIDSKDWRPDGQELRHHPKPQVVPKQQPEEPPADEAWSPALACTPHPTPCGPLIEKVKDVHTPKPSGVGGPTDGLGGRATSLYLHNINNNTNYKRKRISSSISSSDKAKASAQTLKTSMAARIREIVLGLNREFTVDEITKELVKSLSISPLPSTPAEWEPWNKQVSNELGRLVKRGILVRVKGKKGVYSPFGCPPEQASSHQLEDKTGYGTLRILRVIPKPLPMRLPLDLERYVLIYPGDFIVVAGATNAGKTAFFLNLAWLNRDLFQVNYLTSELSEVRLAIRLHDFCAVHGTSLDEWDEHVKFRERSSDFAPALKPACLNVVDYLELYKDFQEAGLPMKEMFRRQQGQPGVTFVGLQMKHGNVLGRGGSLGMEKPFLYLTIDYFQECGLNRLVIEKAKDPANKNINPNGMDFWFKIEEGCKFVSVETPKDAGKLIDKARKQANGGK